MRRLAAPAVRAVLVIAAWSMPAAAQSVRVAAVPDSGTVGTVFRVAVQVDAPAGTEIVFPDTLPLNDPLENTSLVDRRDQAEGETARVTAVYAVTAWRPGVHPLPSLAVGLRGGGAERTLDVTMPQLVVRSVLPADTTGIELKPAASVIGRNWVLWPLIVAAALLLLAIAALIWWWRRRRRMRPVAVLPAIGARERALAQLDSLAAEDLAGRGDLHGFYSRLSETLRQYLAGTRHELGADLTTTELAALLPWDDTRVRELMPLLQRADMVKFARAQPTVSDAADDLRQARAWIAAEPEPQPMAEAA